MPTDTLSTALTYAGEAAVIGLSLVCAAHALMNKSDPRSAIGWIALCILAPVVGPIIYLLIGVNRAIRPAHKDTTSSALPLRLSRIDGGQVRRPPSPTHGNQVTGYFAADTVYRAMLDAIANARQSVWLSQYIFESGGIGESFVDALGQAVARGVQVCVILDRVGMLYSRGSTRRRLEKAGVHVAVFSPTRSGPFSIRLNLRNHRKILITDGREAFVGGMNIRNGYIAEHEHTQPRILDAHFLLTGDVVNDLVAVFQDDWHYATGIELPPSSLPDRQETDGNAKCRVTVDGPDNEVDLLTVMICAAIAAAKERVRIMTPYFLPPREIVTALQAAAISGISVEVVLPEKNNLPFVHWAMQHSFPSMLRYGISIRYQPGPFDHSKLIVIDEHTCIVGSANLDARSLRLNFELAVEVWDRALADKLTEHISASFDGATPVTLDTLKSAQRWARARNAIAWLGTPYL